MELLRQLRHGIKTWLRSHKAPKVLGRKAPRPLLRHKDRWLPCRERISDYSYRYSLIVARLKIAIDVLIENGKFTNSGKALIKKFENKIERHLSNEKCKISLSKKEIIAHHRKWKKK